MVERSLRILSSNGAFGMVLPLSVSFSTKRTFVKLREKLQEAKGAWWFSHYDRIPSALFGNDVRTRCTIAIFANGEDDKPTEVGHVFVTELNRWTHQERAALFSGLRYSEIHQIEAAGIPKLGSQAQAQAYEALANRGLRLGVSLRGGPGFATLAAMAPRFPEHAVFVGGTAYNWFPVWREIPPTTDMSGSPSLPARTTSFVFPSDYEADLVFALLGSSLGYWWWAVASDGFNLKKWLVERFPLSPQMLPDEAQAELSALGADLREELRKHYVYKENRGRIGNWFLPACWREIRAIDDALCRYLPALSPGVMEDIRAFNERFSTSELNDNHQKDSDLA
jgi:hypothetical protein